MVWLWNYWAFLRSKLDFFLEWIISEVLIWIKKSNFETGFLVVEFVLEVNVLAIEKFRGNVFNVIDAKKYSPLVEFFLQQKGSVEGFLILGDPHEGVFQGNILGFREGLFHFDQFVFPHHQHVTQVAHFRRRVAFRKRRTNVYVWQLLPSFFQVLNLKLFASTNSQISLFVKTLHASSFLNANPHNLQNTYIFQLNTWTRYFI